MEETKINIPFPSLIHGLSDRDSIQIQLRLAVRPRVVSIEELCVFIVCGNGLNYVKSKHFEAAYIPFDRRRRL